MLHNRFENKVTWIDPVLKLSILANVFVNTILRNNVQKGCVQYLLSRNMQIELFEKYLQNNPNHELIMDQPTNPLKLPRCNYPKAVDVTEHGLFELPNHLPLIDFNTASRYRSDRHHPVAIAKFEYSQIIEMAHVMAQSFAVNDPMNRHVQHSIKKPDNIVNATHKDAFGNDNFGPWNNENLFFWFIRLFVLTSASDPIDRIGINEDMLRLSLAICDTSDNIIGGAFNVTLPESEAPMRESDPFLHALLLHVDPIMQLVLSQEHESIDALNQKYPPFKKAHQNGKVGMHFLIARSPLLPTEHTFELLAASAERFQSLGYEFMIITATNQWTGAACEVLGATRVHFLPFRDMKKVATAHEANDNVPYSIDGFISNKDSGMMFYIMKLN